MRIGNSHAAWVRFRFGRIAGFMLFLLSIGGSCFASDGLVIPASKATVRPQGTGNLTSNGTLLEYVSVGETGWYTVIVRARGSRAQDEWPHMSLHLNGLELYPTAVASEAFSGYPFRVRLVAGVHALGVSFLNDAWAPPQDRNLYLESITINGEKEGTGPALASREQCLADGEQRERAVLALTESAIREHRMGDAVIEVVDGGGHPLGGAAISIAQTGHDFLFGANFSGWRRFEDASRNESYLAYYKGLFNYVTLPFYWNSFEPERGKPRYEYMDAIVAWCAAQRIAMKGHPLLWNHPAGQPAWIQGEIPEEEQRLRVNRVINRYRGRINTWDVVNEPVSTHRTSIEAPYRWARSAAPEARLVINEFGHFRDGYWACYEALSAARRNGVAFDIVGMQAHEPTTMAFALDNVWAVLDAYATLGKEIHITEFTPASNGERVTGAPWRDLWNEAEQADYAEKFYRACFAHPAVSAISWWDLCDTGAWVKNGGMLREDLSPKPVYEKLRRLIHEEWETHLEGNTSADGTFTFHGFHGLYDVSVQSGNTKIERRLHLQKNTRNHLKVVLE